MIALLSNVTIESLATRVEKASGQRVFTAPGFDAWKTELLNGASQLWAADVDSIYIILHGAALLADGVNSDCTERLTEPLSIIRAAAQSHKDKTLIVSSLDLPPSPALPFAATDHAMRAAAYWRQQLEALELPVLDLANLAASCGRNSFYNAKMWYFGSLPFSKQGETLLAEEILRAESAVHGKRKKCLVFDLDNTMWGGVIGEDGLHGISIASYGLGSQYRDMQRIAADLATEGVLLAVASKNNEEDALLPFEKHEQMLLRRDDFVSFKANWDPKPVNVAAIAKELNIGLDSLVFIDDNPLEREAVKTALPDVSVPDDFPADSSQLPAFMAAVARKFFPCLRVGDEDRKKTAMYKSESKRNSERQAHASLDDYLSSLLMVLDLHRLRPEETARAAQLTQKTNQFNLTTRRYTEAEVTRMSQGADSAVWMAELKDRFGDYGRIALVIAHINAQQHSAEIDTFLMSCRVMGRGVEDAVLSLVERELAGHGVTLIRGDYIETAKNSPVKDFWHRMGYRPERGSWLREAPFMMRKTFISCPNS